MSTPTGQPAERPPVRFALVAGEASGDLLGAGLVDALRERFPDAEFAGIGGPRMRAAGLDAWHESDELAVMGLAEVLRHLPRLLALRRALRRRLLDWRPDVYVGIDAPDFNLPVERWLKQRRTGDGKLRTVHYVSPSVWAWREGRAARIGRSADRVLCLFPMEPPIYARHGVDARFVGHPLADEMPLEPDRDAARARLGLATERPVLAVLPGSRLGEIARLGPTFIEAARHVAQAVPGLQVLVPAANAACRAALERLLAGFPAARLIDGQARRAMIASDAILLASGTATLEAMLAKRPMVVAYKVAPLTYRIVKGLGLLKVDHYALPNVLAGEAVVPELMQDDCTVEALSAATVLALREGTADPSLPRRFRAIHETLRRDASREAAGAIAELVRAAPAGARP
nr:lipid-A-disaccharide synthase [Lysobacter spongiae]